MQKCQDQLDFNIETPSDEEIAKRFARRQGALSEIDADLFDGPQQYQKPRAKAGHKQRNRKSKHQKKMERINRAKETCSEE